VIFHYRLRHQRAIRALGHHHHLLHIWRKVGSLLTLP
jgi:hypothetical protein